MKLLAVFLLVGLALAASAVPIHDDDLERELDQLDDEIGDEFIIYAESGFIARLKERFANLLEKMKNAVGEGKGVDSDMFKKAEDFYNKLRNLGVELSEKMKQIFEDLRSKVNGNAPQHADFRELLRKLRDRIQNHEFDEERVRGFIEKLFGKSEITDQLMEKIKTGGANGKQRVLDFLNRIIGDKQEAFAPQHGFELPDYKDLLRELRDRIQNHKFDEAKVREFLEKIFGKSEMTDQLIEKIRTGGEKGKKMVIDFINRIIGDKQTQSGPILDRMKRQFEEMMEKFQKQVEEGGDVNENMWKKAQDFYEKLTNVGAEFSEKIKQIYEDLKSRFNKQNGPIMDRMKRQFEEMMQKFQKQVEEGGEVNENMWKKAQDFYEKLTKLGAEFSDKIKQIYEDLKNKVNQNQSSVHHADSIASRIKERLEELISRMKKNMDDGRGVRGDLFKKLTDIYDKFKNLGGELNGKFKQMFEDLRSKFQRNGPVAQHSVKEIYEKVKKFFKDLNIDLKEKFVKFGEYVKEQYHKVIDQTKTNVENVKNIAKTFVDDSKKISKDMAEEALEFFRPYKDDLGTIWSDVVDKVRDVLKKQD